MCVANSCPNSESKRRTENRMTIANLSSRAREITDHWSPEVVAQVNDQYIKVAKVKGEFCWHSHDEEDEAFLVLKGRLVIEYRDREVVLGEGDLHVVPRGVEHNPRADEECWVALIETVTTRHTGDVIDPRTKSIDAQLGHPA